MCILISNILIFSSCLLRRTPISALVVAKETRATLGTLEILAGMPAITTMPEMVMLQEETPKNL
jgi:hypothetical protein